MATRPVMLTRPVWYLPEWVVLRYGKDFLEKTWHCIVVSVPCPEDD